MDKDEMHAYIVTWMMDRRDKIDELEVEISVLEKLRRLLFDPGDGHNNVMVGTPEFMEKQSKNENH